MPPISPTPPQSPLQDIRPPQPSIQGMSYTPANSGKKSGGAGPVVGIIIIVTLMVLGGLYFWGMRLNSQDSQDQPRSVPNESTTQ